MASRAQWNIRFRASDGNRVKSRTEQNRTERDKAELRRMRSVVVSAAYRQSDELDVQHRLVEDAREVGVHDGLVRRHAQHIRVT